MPSSSTSSTRTLRTICLVLIIVGVLAAAFNITRRIHAERSAQAVDLVVDYPEVQSLATAQGVPIESIFARLKTAGTTAVALPEETLATLENEGQIAITPNQLRAASPLATRLRSIAQLSDDLGPVFTVTTSNAQVENTIYNGLSRFAAKSIVLTTDDGASHTFYVRGTKDIMTAVGLGISPAKVKHITNAGLRVVPRLVQSNGTSAETLRTSLAAVADALPTPAEGQPRAVVIFDGTTIPGYRALIPTLADSLAKDGLLYGAIEFGKQKGDATLGTKLHGQLVRVHSISLEELSTMSPGEAIQRFGLAVKDRNIRVLYVHFPPVANDDPVQAAAAYVQGIAHEVSGMHGMGFVLSSAKSAHPFTPVTTPAWVLVLLFAGAGASVIFWITAILPAQLPRRGVVLSYVVLVLGMLGAAGSALVQPAPGRMIFGLLAAIGFPLLALTWAYRQVDRLGTQSPTSAILPAIGALLVTTGITLLGALIIAASMAESTYLVKVGQFAGVKAALAFPLLIFALMVATDGVARSGETLAEYATRIRSRLQGMLGQPLYVWVAVIGAVAVGIVGIMLMRSGNDGGVGVSGAELKLRSLLEQWLIARPRTKEFAFGVPLFLFSMIAAANRRRTLALVLLLGAAIGQVDVLNTYCHAHTPILLSLLRTVNGLWLGVVIGVAILVLFARRTLRPQAARVEAIDQTM